MALVNYENVVEAAEELIANGQKASVRNVIKQIGGGSPNSVLKFLGEYKSGRPVIRAADVELDLSIVLAIRRQMQTVVTEATVAAEDRAAALSDDLDTLAQSSKHLESENEQLTTELTAARDEIDALIAGSEKAAAESANKLDAAQAKIIELSAGLHEERQRSAEAQVALGKIQARADAVPLLEALIEKLQNELKAEGSSRAAAEQRAAVADAQTKLINEQVTKTAADAEKTEQVHKDAIVQLRKDLSEARQQTRDAVADLKSARAQIDALRDKMAVEKPAVGDSTTM